MISDIMGVKEGGKYSLNLSDCKVFQCFFTGHLVKIVSTDRTQLNVILLNG